MLTILDTPSAGACIVVVTSSSEPLLRNTRRSTSRNILSITHEALIDRFPSIRRLITLETRIVGASITKYMAQQLDNQPLIVLSRGPMRGGPGGGMGRAMYTHSQLFAPLIRSDEADKSRFRANTTRIQSAEGRSRGGYGVERPIGTRSIRPANARCRSFCRCRRKSCPRPGHGGRRKTSPSDHQSGRTPLGQPFPH